MAGCGDSLSRDLWDIISLRWNVCIVHGQRVEVVSQLSFVIPECFNLPDGSQVGPALAGLLKAGMTSEAGDLEVMKPVLAYFQKIKNVL